ncbi:MAG: hypothetical protein WBH47_27160 [Streptosporangiaceae bacterium]
MTDDSAFKRQVRGAEADRIRADLADLTGTRVALYIWEVRSTN